jgi:hypothetical protein
MENKDCSITIIPLRFWSYHGVMISIYSGNDQIMSLDRMILVSPSSFFFLATIGRDIVTVCVS